MSSELFPFVKFNKDLCFDKFKKQFPLSRKRALKRTIEQQCVVAEKHHELINQLECEREAILALESAEGLKPIEITDLNAWEDLILGGNFGSTVLKQGPNVLEKLSPVLCSNFHVRVIDPYLLPYDRYRRRIEASGLLAFVKEPSKIRSITAITRLFDRGQLTRYQKNEEFSAKNRARDIAKWISGEPSAPQEIKILLFEKRPRNSRLDIHDRFIGFANRLTATRPWHALAIGYGVSAFTTEKDNLVSLARVRSDYFSGVWTMAEKECTWLVLRSSDQSVGVEWKPVKKVRDIVIYEKR